MIINNRLINVFALKYIIKYIILDRSNISDAYKYLQQQKFDVTTTCMCSIFVPQRLQDYKADRSYTTDVLRNEIRGFYTAN